MANQISKAYGVKYYVSIANLNTSIDEKIKINLID